MSEAQRGCPFVRSLGADAANTGLVASLARHCPVMQKFEYGIYIENDISESSQSSTASEPDLFSQTYTSSFARHINALHAEGRYRVFANLKRHCGFPHGNPHFLLQ
jgi:hypothetical protein